MKATTEMIIKEVNAFNESIQEALASKKINASGEASRSLRVEVIDGVTTDIIRSIGIFYLEFLDTGRGRGKMPPISKLIEWAKIKFGKSEEESTQIAWAVARNIQQLGTLIFRNNKKGIELSKKVVTLRKAINEKLGETAKADVKQLLNKFKKKHLLKM